MVNFPKDNTKIILIENWKTIAVFLDELKGTS
jgi:hypothetical protein